MVDKRIDRTSVILLTMLHKEHKISLILGYKLIGFLESKWHLGAMGIRTSNTKEQFTILTGKTPLIKHNLWTSVSLSSIPMASAVKMRIVYLLTLLCSRSCDQITQLNVHGGEMYYLSEPFMWLNWFECCEHYRFIFLQGIKYMCM